jgi:hypothetical protein
MAKTHLLYKCLQTGTTILASFLLICLIQLGSGSFIPFAFAGGFLIYLCLRPTVKQLGVVVTVALVYAFGYQMQHGLFADSPASGIGTAGAFLGLGSLIVNGIQLVWSTGSQKEENLRGFGEMLLLPALCLLSCLAVLFASWFIPKTYDLFLYAFDSGLGMHPSFAAGKWLRNHSTIAYISAYVYNCLPIYLAVFLAYQIRFAKGSVPDVRLLFAVLGVLGFFLYLICPATGPVHCFNTFPDSPPSLNDSQVELITVTNLPRNAMPSLHFGWALLMSLYAWMRRNWVLALSSTAFVAFTALATLGFGEHYLIDLIVAVPLVVAVLAACSVSSTSVLFRYEVSIGLGVTVGSLTCLRFGVFIGMSSLACWSFVALTLLISIALLAMLVRQVSVQSSEGPFATAPFLALDWHFRA